MTIGYALENLNSLSYKELKRIHLIFLEKIRAEFDNNVKNKYIDICKKIMAEIRAREQYSQDEQFAEKNNLVKESTEKKEVKIRDTYDHDIDYSKTGFELNDLYKMGGIYKIVSPTGKIFIGSSADRIMPQVLDTINALNLKKERKCNKELLKDWELYEGEKAFKISITNVFNNNPNHILLKRELVKKLKDDKMETYNSR